MNGTTYSLAGRHALITGGSRGIGKAIASRLLSLGASATLLARDESALRAAAAELASVGVCDWRRCDVTHEADVNTVIGEFTGAEMRASILINNAGAASSAKFEETGLEAWESMLRTNLTSAYLCTRALLPALVRAPLGRIVSVASTAGLIGYRHVVAYCAAKHGLVGFTRALALELATTGVTVNAVCPGYTDTDMVSGAIANVAARTGKTASEARAALAQRNPQRRLVEAAEVADAVAWLCLPSSQSINGQAISVSGGEVMSG